MRRELAACARATGAALTLVGTLGLSGTMLCSGDATAQPANGPGRVRPLSADGNAPPARGMGLQFRELGDQVYEALLAGDLVTAENIARMRIVMANQLGTPQAKANAMRHLGIVLQRQGRAREAEALLRESLPIVEGFNGPTSIQSIRMMFVLGVLLLDGGRYAEARELLARALERQLKASPQDSDAAQAYNLLARCERMLGRLDEAEALLKQAEAIPPSNEAARDGRPDGARLAARRQDTLFQLAWIAFLRGNFDQARKQAEMSIADSEAARGDAGDFAGSAMVSVNAMLLLANIQIRQSQFDEAEKTLRRASDLAARKLAHERRQTAQIQALLASVYAGRGDTAQAVTLLRGARQAAETADRIDDIAHLDRQLGQLLWQSGDPVAALDPYRQALDAIDRLFAQTQGLDDATRENFIARFTPVYIETLRLLSALDARAPGQGHDREALAVVSRTQSRLFTELLRRADISRLGGDADFRRLRDAQLGARARLAELNRARAIATRGEDLSDGQARPDGQPRPDTNGVDPLVQARTETLRKRLGEDYVVAERALADVDGQLWQRYPRYMELTQPRPVTVDLLQKQLLRPEETLISYFLLPDEALIFVVERDSFTLQRVPVARADIARWIAEARRPEEAAAGGMRNLAQLDPTNLHRLYRTLFEPIRARLRPGRRLLVIGDGPVHTLPLEMLVTHYDDADRRAFDTARADRKGEALGEYATLDYLGKHYRFAYLPSLSALASIRLYRKPAVRYAGELVSFADPVFEIGQRSAAGEAALTNLQRSVRPSSAMLSIPRLPETADEAREIAGIVGGRTDVYLREQAQEYLAKTLDLTQTRYLHFATHGLLGGEFVQVREALSAQAADAGDVGDRRPGGTAGGERQRNLVVAAAPATAGPPGAAAPRPPAPVAALPSEEAQPALPAVRGQPALVLSLGGDMRGEDGLLTMSEIIEKMDINSQLVVLSACNTAGEGSDANNGEGFAGLTRAFMYAGAQGLIVSHWSVESRSTQALMTAMFRQLRAGADTLGALEQARGSVAAAPMPEQRVARAHPYFWAPFVYVGD